MICRNLWVDSNHVDEPISVVEGSNRQEIAFILKDMDASSISEFRARSKTSTGIKETDPEDCRIDIVNNTVVIMPKSGFFLEGKCVLWLEFKIGASGGYIYSHGIPVNCDHNYFNDTTDDASTVASAAARAELAANTAAADARQLYEDGLPGIGSTSISDIADGTLTGAIGLINEKVSDGFKFKRVGAIESDATETSGTYGAIKLSCNVTNNYIISVMGNNASSNYGLYMVRVNGSNIYVVAIKEAATTPPSITNAGENVVSIRSNSTAVCQVAVCPLFRGWDDIEIERVI